jgi:transcriptional regulator with PAS, ATPase and Fis domain
MTFRSSSQLAAVYPIENAYAEPEPPRSFETVLGDSPLMHALLADLARIAPTDVTLLLEGETGTGKDVVAHAVHRASERADKPYVVFDCGAVAPTLVESELFGYERGAFTGAVSSRPGLFELAHNGTLFLDELGELPKDLQPKLLRVLENRQVRRLGGQRTIHVDVRVIAATNRNLLAEVQQGTFREDLYFRLAAAHLQVPALRDRIDDLPLLVEHFLAQNNPPRSMADLPPEACDLFRRHRWPGNIRELRNMVQRMLVMPDRALASIRAEVDSVREVERAEVDTIGEGPVRPLRDARKDANDAFERDYLRAILKHSNGNVARAAALAQVSRQVMTKLVRKHADVRSAGTSARWKMPLPVPSGEEVARSG